MAVRGQILPQGWLLMLNFIAQQNLWFYTSNGKKARARRSWLPHLRQHRRCRLLRSKALRAPELVLFLAARPHLSPRLNAAPRLPYCHLTALCHEINPFLASAERECLRPLVKDHSVDHFLHTICIIYMSTQSQHCHPPLSFPISPCFLCSGPMKQSTATAMDLLIKEINKFQCKR